MGRTRMLQELRVMRFDEVYGRFERGSLSCEQAADVLGVSHSTFRRYRRRYEAEGRCHINWAGWKESSVLGWVDAPALVQASPPPAQHHPSFDLALRKVHAELS